MVFGKPLALLVGNNRWQSPNLVIITSELHHLGAAVRGLTYIEYIPRNMHTVFALLCFVVVIHWLIFPYPSGLLHWHWGNLTIVPVPAKQPWWIWINTSCEFIMNDCITTTKQSTTKPCTYLLGYTVEGLIAADPCTKGKYNIEAHFRITRAIIGFKFVIFCIISARFIRLSCDSSMGIIRIIAGL